jgi:hypothetical protein
MKEMYRFNAILIKMPVTLFPELEKTILHFIWKHKKTLNSQSNLEKRIKLATSQ